MRVDITALYCCLDDFAKLFEDWERHKLIDTGRKRNRQGKLEGNDFCLIRLLMALPKTALAKLVHLGKAISS